MVFWWVFDYPIFAENQRLIFDEKMDNQKSVKNKNTVEIYIEKSSKKNKYDQNNDKMLQKRKIYRTWKFAAYKKHFSGFLNWILGHLQSSDEENKIAIRKISIRAIKKLSYCDQQTIVDGPNFNLTNGEISIIFPSFFVKFVFQIISSFCFNFDCFSNYFNQIYVLFLFFMDSNQ